MSIIFFVFVKCFKVDCLNFSFSPLFIIFSYILYEIRHAFRGELDISAVARKS